MKASILTILVSSIASTNAAVFPTNPWKGFNMAANGASGACKTQDDWASDFNIMKTLVPGSDAVRVYASSDCNTLANAVPAAINAGIQILAGIWTVDATHFSNEKGALLAASQQYGVNWLAGISVGSESLYRNEQTASELAAQIYDVRGMMTTVVGGDAIPVGHVDTWTMWVEGANTEVIVASDFIGTDGYPYFQNTEDNSIGNAKTEFFASVDAVTAVAQGKPVWITETGWPTWGPQNGNAVCSIPNAQTYWKEVACSAISTYSTFWYALDDYVQEPALSFGVASGSTAKFDLSC